MHIHFHHCHHSTICTEGLIRNHHDYKCNESHYRRRWQAREATARNGRDSASSEIYTLLIVLQAEMASQRGNSQEGEVFILPTVRINHAQYRGKLAYSEVLKAICAGFTKNNEPEVCLRVAEDDCREGSIGDRECKAK